MEGGGVHVKEGEVFIWKRRCACGGGRGVHVKEEEVCMWRRGGVHVEEEEVCMWRRGMCAWGGTSNIYFFCAHTLGTILPPFSHRLSIKTSGVIVLHVVAATRMMR